MPTGADSFPATGPNALAKFGPRAIARLLDVALVAVPLLAGVSVVLVLGDYDPNRASEGDALPPWLAAAWFVTVFTYETLAVAWKGRTLGKLALGIRVARFDNGRRPLWWQAGIRVALPAVIATIPHPLTQIVFIGIYFSSQFDPMGRGLHDKAAGTVVVTTR